MSGRSILVIDDEETMLSLCGRVLRAMGHEPVLAATLREGLEKIQSLDRLDLLVSDLRLPDGNGTQALAAARARFPQAGLLAITAYLAGMEGELAALGLGKDDIITKPFAVDGFEDAVKAKLRGLEGTV